MKRRDFISLVGGGAAATWSLAARAQQSAMPIVGFLNQGSANASFTFPEAFRKGLSEAGFVEGKNVAVEYRWAEAHYDQLPQLAAELVARKVAVIAAAYALAAKAAMAATSTIPIVFVTGTDPVRSGLVSSLNRPGGNVTGLALLSGGLGAKRLGLLHDLVPPAQTVAVLINPNNPPVSEPYVNDVQEAARALGLNLVILHASTDREIDTSFATMDEQRIGALIVAIDSFLLSRIAYIVALALRHAIPTIYSNREAALAGGLMSYDTDLADAYRLQGNYVGRILKGAKPGDLEVEQPTKFNFVINLGTAKAMGITIPSGLLAIADEVID